VQLVSPFQRLSLLPNPAGHVSSPAIPEQVTLHFQDFELRDKGPTLSLSCACGADFLEDAGKMVKEKISVGPEIFFCFYQRGVRGSVELSESCAFWHSEPTSCIYYWYGEKPESPTKMIAELKEDQKQMKQRMRYLEITSTSAQEQEKVWNKRKAWSFDELDQRFRGSDTVADVGNALELIRKLLEKPTVEQQDPLFKFLQALVPRGNLWKDWHSSGVTFAGREHKIDSVLLTRDIKSLDCVDVLVEFKKDISTEARQRKVVLQLLERMHFVFEAQRMRQQCWGIGMDARRVLFVSCEENLVQIRVSSIMLLMDESALSLLAQFFSGPPTTRGYVAVVMPTLWGMEAMCLLDGGRSKGHAVFGMDEKVVAKVAGSESSMTHELEVLRELQPWAGLVCPQLVMSALGTGNDSWPYGFQMTRYKVVSVKSEVDVLSVMGGAFWRLAMLHELGYVHGDVKPSNFLMHGTEVLLCDFGNAVRGPGRGLKGGTPAFRVIDGFFLECDFQCDLEGLYWTTLTLWLQVKRKKLYWKGLKDEKRRSAYFALCAYEANRAACPIHPKLFAYLCKQGRGRSLINPLHILSSVPFSTLVNWKKDVCDAVELNELPECPEKVLDWFATRRGICHESGQ